MGSQQQGETPRTCAYCSKDDAGRQDWPAEVVQVAHGFGF